MKSRAIMMASGAIAISALAIMTSTPAQAGLILGFEGTGLKDNAQLGNAFLPPDTMGAVGTTQFLESTNGSYTVYDKNTGAVIQRTSMNTFWGTMGLAPGLGVDPEEDDEEEPDPAVLGSSGDQRILFDHYNDRWITVGFALNTGNQIRTLNIGVSDTADATGTWKGTTLNVLPNGPFSCSANLNTSCVGDYPTLGMDDKGVYIGTNNFNPNFRGTSLFTIPAADLFDGAPSLENMTRFNTTYFPITADNGFAIQGAVNWGGNASNVANILAVSTLAFADVYYKISGVNGAGATVTPATYVNIGPYGSNSAGRQPDGTRLVDVLDDRISANVYQAGGKLYAVQTVTPPGLDRTVIRWTVLDAATGALLQTGDIGRAGCDFYQGSIAVNEAGYGLIGYNRSCAPGVLPGNDGRIAFLGQQVGTSGSGFLYMLMNEMLFRLSDINDYHCGTEFPITNCRNRWGDYSAVTIDPTDPFVFYAIGEYSGNWVDLLPLSPSVRANWHTYIAAVRIDAPEPGTLAIIGMALLSLLGLGAMRRRADA